MNPEKLREKITEELNNTLIIAWHGITKENINRHLIDLRIIELETWDNQVLKYWLVLDEDSNHEEQGYRVVYDERENSFGLATKTMMEGSDIGYLIGLYGSLIDTLHAM